MLYIVTVSFFIHSIIHESTASVRGNSQSPRDLQLNSEFWLLIEGNERDKIIKICIARIILHFLLLTYLSTSLISHCEAVLIASQKEDNIENLQINHADISQNKFLKQPSSPPLSFHCLPYLVKDSFL